MHVVDLIESGFVFEGLRSLQGAVVVLRALSETADSIEPVALEALTRLMDEPLERITACWREAFDATRDR